MRAKSVTNPRTPDASQIQSSVRKSRSLGRYAPCAQASSNVRFGWRVQPIDATPSNLARGGGVRWRGLHGYGSRRSRGLSFGSAGRTVSVWRISLGHLRGGTRAVSIVSWLSMAALLRSRAGELRECCGLRNARRSRGVLPPVGRCGGSHKAFDDRPRLSVGRLGAMAAAAPIGRARPIGAPGSGRCARSFVAWPATRGYDGASARAAVVAGADLRLAEAATPCRPRHADIARNDLSKSLYSDPRHSEETADGASADGAADASSQRRQHQERTGTDRRYGLHPRTASRG